MQAHLTTWEDRFWAKVEEDSQTGCWNWTAAMDGHGYGRFGGSGGCRRGKTSLAHRIAFELVIGMIRGGLELDHLCRNTVCVNPAHLEPVTHRENLLRGRTVPAAYAARTHCGRGHPFDSVNSYRDAEGRRRCRACLRDNALRAYYRRKAAA
jgi:hypothetical protein